MELPQKCKKLPLYFYVGRVRQLTTLNTHSEAVITKQCQEEWDSGTDSRCRLQLVEKDGHAVTLWPQISPPHPEKRRTKTDTFHLSSLLFIVFWSEGAIYSPLFLFYVRLCASPAKPFSTQWQSVKPRGGTGLPVHWVKLEFSSAC